MFIFFCKTTPNTVNSNAITFLFPFFLCDHLFLSRIYFSLSATLYRFLRVLFILNLSLSPATYRLIFFQLLLLLLLRPILKAAASLFNSKTEKKKILILHEENIFMCALMENIIDDYDLATIHSEAICSH